MKLRPIENPLFVHVAVVVVVVAFAHLALFLCCSRLGFILRALLRGFRCLLATAAAACALVGGFRHLSRCALHPPPVLFFFFLFRDSLRDLVSLQRHRRLCVVSQAAAEVGL